jgi:hypothetical protein
MTMGPLAGGDHIGNLELAASSANRKESRYVSISLLASVHDVACVRPAEAVL